MVTTRKNPRLRKPKVRDADALLRRAKKNVAAAAEIIVTAAAQLLRSQKK